MESAANTSKWEQRTERFVRYERSEQTVREFCRHEGVSVPSFYQWKQKIRHGSGDSRLAVTSPSPIRKTPSTFKPILVTSLTPAPGMTIRLPQGIVIELGQDRATIKLVMRQLLTHSAVMGGESC